MSDTREGYFVWSGGTKPIRYEAVSADEAAEIWLRRHPGTSRDTDISVVAESDIRVYTTAINATEFAEALADPRTAATLKEAERYADSLIARGHCACHLVVNCPGDESPDAPSTKQER